jgi:prephenate dehydrogenase
MGRWLTEELCHDHEVAVYDSDIKQLKHFFNVTRFKEIKELKDFKPELVINCATLNHTIKAFDSILKYLPPDAILADITSVKYGLEDYYKNSGFRFVSTHPMFGPTFANIRDLKEENAVIIKESDEEGKAFFRKFFGDLQLNIFEYSFDKHDRTMAYSLATPFVSTLVFGGCMTEEAVPGTTFKKHMHIAENLMNEDDYLLSEIMFNPYVVGQIKKINSQLSFLTHIINDRDFEEMKKYLNKVRDNIKKE